MLRIEPALVPAVSDLARALRELAVPFGVVGALVPELLLDAGPARMTNDADVAVIVASLDDFESLKDRLTDYGFARPGLPHRMQHRSGGLVDMLPFSESIAPERRSSACSREARRFDKASNVFYPPRSRSGTQLDRGWKTPCLDARPPSAPSHRENGQDRRETDKATRRETSGARRQG